jgi:hypothetical protein
MATRSRAVLHLVGLGEARISAVLADRIARAFLLTDAAAREMALDANAHLVTDLRTERVWLVRYAAPEGIVADADEEDGA